MDELEIESSALMGSHSNGEMKYGSMRKTASSLPSNVAIRVSLLEKNYNNNNNTPFLYSTS